MIDEEEGVGGEYAITVILEIVQDSPAHSLVAVQLGAVELNGRPLHDPGVHAVLLGEQLDEASVQHVRNALQYRLFQASTHRTVERL